MSKIEIVKTELFKYDLYLKVLKIAADLKQVVRTSNLVKKNDALNFIQAYEYTCSIN